MGMSSFEKCIKEETQLNQTYFTQKRLEDGKSFKNYTLDRQD